MAPQMGTQQLIGHRLIDNDGAAVGKIGQVFYDDQTGVAKWITVRTGLFGSRENLVPLVGAEMIYDALQVPWSRNKIKGAPSFDVDQHISVEQEDRVYAHYGLNPEVPEQRVPVRLDRPRGRHARPGPGERDPRSAGQADGSADPQQGDQPPQPDPQAQQHQEARRDEQAQHDQRRHQQIWEPDSESARPRQDSGDRP